MCLGMRALLDATVDILLLDFTPVFLCTLKMWYSQKAKIMIQPNHPLHPIPSHPTGLMDWPINDWGNSNPNFSLS